MRDESKQHGEFHHLINVQWAAPTCAHLWKHSALSASLIVVSHPVLFTAETDLDQEETAAFLGPSHSSFQGDLVEPWLARGTPLGELDGRIPSSCCGRGLAIDLWWGHKTSKGIGQLAKQSCVPMECSERHPCFAKQLVFRCKLIARSAQ